MDARESELLRKANEAAERWEAALRAQEAAQRAYSIAHNAVLEYRRTHPRQNESES